MDANVPLTLWKEIHSYNYANVMSDLRKLPKCFQCNIPVSDPRDSFCKTCTPLHGECCVCGGSLYLNQVMVWCHFCGVKQWMWGEEL